VILGSDSQDGCGDLWDLSSAIKYIAEKYGELVFVKENFE